MTMHDEIEARLIQAFELSPSEEGLRRLDQRVARAIAQPTAIPYRGGATRRMILRPLLLLAAFVLLTGAVVGGARLLDQIFESSGMPRWRIAWDRAERLDIKQTDAGITITLERAYADLNQVLVGFTVEGLPEAPGTGHGEAHPIRRGGGRRAPSARSATAPAGGSRAHSPPTTPTPPATARPPTP